MAAHYPLPTIHYPLSTIHYPLSNMRIGIDAHAIGARQGGNETYIANLIKSLAEIDGDNLYTIYLADAGAAAQWREKFTTRYKNFNVRLLPPPTPLVRVPVYLVPIRPDVAKPR